MEIIVKNAAREFKNPLYGREIPKALLEKGVPAAIKRLWSQKKLRIPAATAEILPVQEKLRSLLKRAWPDANEKDISWMAADLAGLWEVSRVHVNLVRKLLKMGNTLNRDKLLQISIDLDINWFVNAPGHMQTLKHELARFRVRCYEHGRVL